MLYFVWGALMLGFAALGLIFLQIWKATGDRFFGTFSLAFWMLAIERLLLAITVVQNEAASFVFLIRLVAFFFILAAIWDKNRSSAAQ